MAWLDMHDSSTAYYKDGILNVRPNMQTTMQQDGSLTFLVEGHNALCDCLPDGCTGTDQGLPTVRHCRPCHQ